MNKKFEEIIKNIFNVSELKELEIIQSLWNSYGKLSRFALNEKTIIVKNIILPNEVNHPRGWNTTNSHQRKVKSYQVETNWYKNYANRCDNDCRVPIHHYSASEENELIIVLEDLDAVGYDIRKSSLTKEQVKVCLKWLANFHATYLNEDPVGLWEVGTYWHLETRPDELAEMENGKLKEVAHLIDEKLNNCKYKTFVHGDAKVTNFCFNKDLTQVAAVDFQYVGGGCGIKDIVYLMGSCMSDNQCELHETELLDYYFSELKSALIKVNKTIDFTELEQEWRDLYPAAWTDFTRFLLGWMPTLQKLNSYSEKLKEITLNRLSS